MIINTDFDGTVVTHAFPEIGNDIGAVPVLKTLVENGHQLILFTMRSDIEAPKSDHPEIVPKGGNYLTQAVNWFKKHDILLYGIQSNPTQASWTSSPKSYANFMIDDSALGIPLVRPKNERPYVDWKKVIFLLVQEGLITEAQCYKLFHT